MRRFGQVIRVRPEAEAEYRKIHVQIWPVIEESIREAGIRRYSIFLKDGHQNDGQRPRPIDLAADHHRKVRGAVAQDQAAHPAPPREHS